MKKIPTLFLRTPDRRHVTDQVTPGCEWVLAGEGRATRKYDGTCVSWHDGDWWFRREVKRNRDTPDQWQPADYDETTDKRIGWVPARPDSPFIKPLREAIDTTFDFGDDIPEGTYELVGPKINGNPEGFERHGLVRHGANVVHHVPLDYDGLRDWMRTTLYEGLVWHHPDGRMVKLKRRDFDYSEAPAP